MSITTIDHIPSREGQQKAVDEMARITKPRGHVMITVPNPWNPPSALGLGR